MNALNHPILDDWRALPLLSCFSPGLSDSRALLPGRPHRQGPPLNPAAVTEAIHRWRARADAPWAWGFHRYLAAKPFDVPRRLAEVLADISLTRIPALPPRKQWEGDKTTVFRLLAYQDEFTKPDVELLVRFADWAAVLGDVDLRQPIDLTSSGQDYSQPAVGPLLLAGVVEPMTATGSWKTVEPGARIPLSPVWQPAPERHRLSAQSTRATSELWSR